MEQRKNTRAPLALGLAAVIAGCAANVQKPAATAPLNIEPRASRNIVLNVSGSKAAAESADWEQMKGEWRAAFKSEATRTGAKLSFQEGEPKPTGEPGTLVAVFVNDYRYLSPGARFGFGVMTGNAYIDSKVRFLNLESGKSIGERVYNTSSSAWEGVFSAMTEKQVQAIAKETFDEIKPRP
jgi:hypothetical protein